MMKNKLNTELSNIRFFSRRELLLLLGGTALTSFTSCTNVKSSSVEASKLVGCVVSPEQTAGPYFVDEKLNRSDIRTDPSNGKVSEGIPLWLNLNVFRVSEKKCEPLPNATVDIWHCDAAGLYSDVRDFHGDTRGNKFLRGYQITDKDGKAVFTTIYPGWYGGRTVHIHFKIRSEDRYEFTSQLYFDDAVTAEIHTQKPYSMHGKPDTTNARDGIFRGGGKQLMLELSKKGDGFTGNYNVGFQY